MPNLITHTLFSEDVLARLDDPVFNERRMLFITGGQGPDFLFFHHSDPFADAVIPSDIRKYGTKFHAEHVDDFYLSALDSIDHETDEAIKDDMLAYVCGHLCHWALDSTVHPLIYSRTGNCKGRSAWKHHEYESLLDAALLMYKKKLTIRDYDASKECFSTDMETARAMARVYVPAIRQIYKEDVRPSSFLQALYDWKRIQKKFRDPYNVKKKLLRPLETTLGVKYLLTGFSVPDVSEDNVDICNLLHRSWRHPATGDVHTESVFDLIEIAMDKAITAIHLFCRAAEKTKGDHDAAITDLLAFLGDRNYEMDLPGNPQPVFFDLLTFE